MFDQLAMIVGERAQEYITKARSLAASVRYHGAVDVDYVDFYNRKLAGSLSHMHFVPEFPRCLTGAFPNQGRGASEATGFIGW